MPGDLLPVERLTSPRDLFASKACNVCKVVQPLVRFVSRCRNRDGRAGECKTCRGKRGVGQTPGFARGEAHFAWKGDAALPHTKRERARRLFALAACERCGLPGHDRHHRDGNTGNNAPSNIAILCRRCHMKEDGRLDGLVVIRRLGRGPQPPKACANCQRPSKPLRRGRCGTCANYLRHYGIERPYVNDGRKEKCVRCELGALVAARVDVPQPAASGCVVCGAPVTGAKGREPRCRLHRGRR